MEKKDIFLIIIGGILLAFLLFLPGLTVVKKCPLGLTDDVFPGRCPLYSDTQQTGVCDLSRSESLTASVGFLTGEAAKKRQLVQPEILFFLGLLILAAILILGRKYLWLRYLFLGVSVLYLGIFLSYFAEGHSWQKICPLLSTQLLFLAKGKIVLSLASFLIFLIPILAALIFGAIFCGWLCPLGGIQEFWWRLAGRIKFLKKLQEYISKFKFSRFSFLKYIFLVLIILAVAIWKKPVLCGLDPFGVLWGYFKNPAAWVSLIVFAILAFAVCRPFCRLFCPYGALLSLLSKISIFQLKINKEKCKECKLCEKICFTEAINKEGRINQSDCNRCGECLRKCPAKAIGLRLNK